MALIAFGSSDCGPHTSGWIAEVRDPPEMSEKYAEVCHIEQECMQVCDQSDQEPSLRARCDLLIADADERFTAEVPANAGAMDDTPGGGWVPPSEQSLTPSQIAARSMRSVVTIHAGSALGTGFVIWKRGWIATNLHVVAGEKEIYVSLFDGTKHRVLDVRGLDVERDLVVLRIQRSDLYALTLADVTRVAIGERVVVIGHPLGLEATVSDGLVSATRAMDDGSRVLQISAPISPGSSGGPIINEHGQVIGVSTFLLRGGQNLNFGMSSEYLAPMMRRRFVLSPPKFAQDTVEYRKEVPKTAVKRNIPDLPISSLDGCSGADIDVTKRLVEETNSTAEAVLEAGKPDAAAHVYLGASEDLRSKLSRGCTGIAAVLDGVKGRAAKLGPRDKVAAFHDAFDGLANVIEKRSKPAQ